MGVDLTLLPVEGNCHNWGYAHTLLETGRNYDTHRELTSLHPKPRLDWVLHSFVSRVSEGPEKGEPCYGKVTETPYGEPITYLSSAEIVGAMEKVKMLSEQEKAVLAYLRVIPTCQVALYWH